MPLDLAARYPTTAELLALYPREQHPWTANAAYNGEVALHPDYRRDGENFEVAEACNDVTAEYIAALPAIHAALIRETAEVRRLTRDAQQWSIIRDTVIRLDAETRPGLPMGDDDIVGVVLRVLEHAARNKPQRNTNAIPGALDAS